MKLSTRSRYGMRAVLELALEYGKGPLQINTIAQREGISNKYLEQLVAILKSSGLLKSVRGPKGGYLLAKPPTQVTLYEVFRVLEGPMDIVDCLVHEDFCPRCSDCITRQVWSKIANAMVDVLDSITLQDLAAESRAHQHKTVDYQI